MNTHFPRICKIHSAVLILTLALSPSAFAKGEPEGKKGALPNALERAGQEAAARQNQQNADDRARQAEQRAARRERALLDSEREAALWTYEATNSELPTGITPVPGSYLRERNFTFSFGVFQGLSEYLVYAEYFDDNGYWPSYSGEWKSAVRGQRNYEERITGLAMGANIRIILHYRKIDRNGNKIFNSFQERYLYQSTNDGVTLTWPAQGARLTEPDQTFICSRWDGMRGGILVVGDAPGGDAYLRTDRMAESNQAHGLPTDGRMIHARVTSEMGANNTPVHNDYSFKGVYRLPDFAGRTQDEAVRILQEKQVDVEIVEDRSVDNANRPAGSVLHQEPRAGAYVGEDNRVTLRVNRLQMIMPGLRNLGESEALRVLSNNWVAEPIVTREYSLDVDEAHVIRQSPEAGTQLGDGSVVQLTFSLGKPVMPELTVGLTREQAQARMREAGWPDPIRFEEGLDVMFRPGNVTFQDPAFGTRLDRNTRLRIIVRSENPRVPNMVNVSPAEALRLLRAAGYNQEVITEEIEGEAGKVLRHIPVAGQPFPTGQLVTLHVGGRGQAAARSASEAQAQGTDTRPQGGAAAAAQVAPAAPAAPAALEPPALDVPSDGDQTVSGRYDDDYDNVSLRVYSGNESVSGQIHPFDGRFETRTLRPLRANESIRVEMKASVPGTPKLTVWSAPVVVQERRHAEAATVKEARFEELEKPKELNWEPESKKSIDPIDAGMKTAGDADEKTKYLEEKKKYEEAEKKQKEKEAAAEKKQKEKDAAQKQSLEKDTPEEK